MGIVASAKEGLPDELSIQDYKIKKHVLVGIGAGILLLLFYMSILTLLQGREHALSQMASQWYWILALATGLGIQAGLFFFIRQTLHERRKSATASVATSGGISAGSMVACCAHHLSDVLPLLGISTLSAFLVSYQLFFIVIGILANAVGITIMLETIQHHSLCPKLANSHWNMSWLKRGTMISALVIAPIALFLIV